MNISEFKKLPKNVYAFNAWRWDQNVAAPLGEFFVEFHMVEDSDPPDEEMVKRAAELVQYAQTHGDYLLDIVYGAYRFCASECDPDWLESNDVPADLTREKVREYLESEPCLVVTRHLDWDEAYDSTIYIVPLWDEEHALTLKFQGGALVSANDSPFKIEDGVLRLLDEQ